MPNLPPRTPRVWGYGRASTDNQRITVPFQEERWHAYYDYFLKDKGVEKGAFFKDEATTSRVPLAERPQGGLLMREMRPGDHLVIYRLDRAFRNVEEASRTLKTLDANQITLHMVDLNIDLSTPNGRLIFHFLASIAQWEREMISERTREALEWKKARGLPSNRAAVGWKKVGIGRDSRFVPDTKGRLNCYLVAELRNKHKLTWEEIGRQLRLRGVKGPKTQDRKNPAGEISNGKAQKWYKAAMAGFPLSNGARQHVFPWEPDLWRSWGIEYTGDQA